MPSEANHYWEEAAGYWQAGQPLEAGRILFENLPLEIRPEWAANILMAMVKRTGVSSPYIENVLEIADDPSRWTAAHDAFSLVRDLTLELSSLTARSAEQVLLLRQALLAELVAKVIYNATNPVDEFDEDSGWWVAVCVEDILDSLNDQEFSRSMWAKLCVREAVGINRE